VIITRLRLALEDPRQLLQRLSPTTWPSSSCQRHLPEQDVHPGLDTEDYPPRAVAVPRLPDNSRSSSTRLVTRDRRGPRSVLGTTRG